MKNPEKFTILSKTLKKEETGLREEGYNSWESLANLSDQDISYLIKNQHLSNRNLRFIRCMALFICELEMSQEQAALLIHSGVSSIKALAILSPQELITKTARLESILVTKRKSQVDLKIAITWISKAKSYMK